MNFWKIRYKQMQENKQKYFRKKLQSTDLSTELPKELFNKKKKNIINKELKGAPFQRLCF